MDTIEIEIAGELEHGRPLRLSTAVTRMPPEYIDDHEIVYRVRSAPDMERGDLLIIEPRNTAFTGELVVAFLGSDLYLGHWWAKNGLQELRVETGETIEDVLIAGAVTAIVRPA